MAASHDPTILPPAIAATLRDHHGHGLIILAGNPCKFAHRASRDDDGKILLNWIGERLLAHRNAEAIGGCQGNQVSSDFHLHTL